MMFAHAETLRKRACVARLTHHAYVIPLRSQNPALQAAEQPPALEQDHVATSRRLLERAKSLNFSQPPSLLFLPVLFVILLLLLLRRDCECCLHHPISISIPGSVTTPHSPLAAAAATIIVVPGVSRCLAGGPCRRCCSQCPCCSHRCCRRFRSRRRPSFSFNTRFVEKPTVYPSAAGTGRSCPR